ncbi:MAG: ferritin [Bacteroides sp.]|nr:ferritin [Bacteroides sp.]MDD2644680.1 ferritin [Bacteroides sp.]MDD4055488.1 ferritin [Bacteroides sp.]MDD4719851.1 ferritin [Bacteroides sp.]NLI63872.1 ferritin [Bacteroidales bacterium]
MISEKLLKELNGQITAELWASNLYLSMSYYMEHQGYSGFAQWLKVQSEEEREHAYDFANYILSRGCEVKIDKIDVVPQGWGTPLELFEHVYQHECHISKLINKLMTSAKEEKDYATESFLWKYVIEQREEEENTSGVVDKLKKADKGGLLFIDAQLGRRED